MSKRFSRLARPAPLATTFGLLLLSIFIWQYSKNPEWFNSYSPNEEIPNSEIDLSGLSPAEQAAIADIDNLTVLFNELGIESGGIPNIQVLAEEGKGPAGTARDSALSLAQPSGAGADNASRSPFAPYLEQYEFSVQMPNQNQASSSGNRLTGFNPSPMGATANRADPYRFTNPLTAALQSQASLSPSQSDRVSNPLGGNAAGTPRSPQATNTEATPTETTAPTSNYTGEFSSQTVTIPGIEFPVLPTLPQMSPPPGTTGYTPPPTLELMPPLPGTNRSSSTFPSGSSSLAPSSAGVPDLSNLTRTPNLNIPQVDVSNRYVTPYTPTVPAAATPQTATPAPFSTNRPQGSGYINTFSNPSTPRN